MATAKKAKSRAPAKKAAVKKTAAKKAAAKKAPAKKAAAKKVPAKKAPAKKVPAKKAPAKKVTAKKVAAKKAAPAKKVVAKKPAAPRKTTRAAAAFIDPAQQLDKLSAEAVEAPLPRGARGLPEVAAMPADFFAAYTGAAVGEADFAAAAQALQCEVAAVKAVAEVESRGAGFDAQKRPTILYERHVFARCTVPPGKFDAAAPDLSGFRKPYAPGTYGNKDQQYVKLARAMQLDPVAALKAPSWGMFQILGENHQSCGFASVQEFVKAMTVSEAEHLKAFVAFVRSNGRLLQAIRQKNWAAFAASYNGPAFATFKYDTKMAAAYAKHAG